MKKEQKCTVAIGDKNYKIEIQISGAKADLLVDGEKLARLWWKGDDYADQELDVRVGGKVCQFVVYNGVPDFSVDGILQFAQAEEEKSFRFYKKLEFFGGVVMTLAGIFGCYCYAFLTASGAGVLWGGLSLAAIIAFTFGGIALILHARRKKLVY